MDTIISIFHNVMPWVGTWFTIMTLIFLGAVICGIFSEKLFSFYDVTRYAFDTRFIIVLLVPMLMVVVIAMIVDGIFRILSFLRKIRGTS